jgi:prevent-host-death family protein
MLYNIGVTMQTLTSAKVQANFGQAIDIAKSGEPVTITQYGRPTAMLFSYKEGEELLRLRALASVNQYYAGKTDSPSAEAPALSMEELDELVHALRP